MGARWLLLEMHRQGGTRPEPAKCFIKQDEDRIPDTGHDLDEHAKLGLSMLPEYTVSGWDGGQSQWEAR